MSTISGIINDSSTVVGYIAIGFISAIVLLDGFRYLSMERGVPRLGVLPRGGFAWATTFRMEYERNWANVITILVMAIIPYLLNPILDIPTVQIILFPLVLGGMLLLQIVPKRYAITQDRLSADGFTFEWENVVWTGWKGGSRIVLQRRGWWVLAPLPLGGSKDDLEQAALRIEAAVTGRWDEIENILSEQE
ncbi:MAG: hypothetical protein QGH13_01590 [Candidatus Thalassarchaeaceae archaeon]|nr:hypothetical protein [Candidatus Thalassarchaeaceae archaeon]|tara:strand:- start:238 stop:813 length:576 start_codon:yes stop_codon:yes gene_type:complete